MITLRNVEGMTDQGEADGTLFVEADNANAGQTKIKNTEQIFLVVDIT